MQNPTKKGLNNTTLQAILNETAPCDKHAANFNLLFRSKLVDKLLQPACRRLIIPFLKGEKRRQMQRRCYCISVSFFFTRMRD